MKIYRHFDLPPTPGGRVVTVGSFDGLHLGHRHLMERLKSEAAAAGAVALAVTFNEHPRKTLAGVSPHLLTTRREKMLLFEEIAVPEVLMMDFTPDIALLEAGEFVRDCLIRGAGMVELLAGPGFAMGRGRAGDAALLAGLADEEGFKLVAVEAALYRGQPVSSTRLRQEVAAGHLATVAGMLGRPYSMTGRVSRGRAVGREVGYPTANLEPDPLKLLPPDGVYASRVSVGGRLLDAVVHIGVRPTFGRNERLVEAHCLDYDGQMYGAEITVFFIERLREEICFSSADSLAVQIASDILQARRVLLRR